jgi:hypothetical protein
MYKICVKYGLCTARFLAVFTELRGESMAVVVKPALVCAVALTRTQVTLCTWSSLLICSHSLPWLTPHTFSFLLLYVCCSRYLMGPQIIAHCCPPLNTICQQSRVLQARHHCSVLPVNHLMILSAANYWNVVWPLQTWDSLLPRLELRWSDYSSIVFFANWGLLFVISGFHGGECEDDSFLGYSAR